MVNILNCSLSLWRGDGEMCRWCNADAARGGRKFCSRECTAAYANNHQYLRGRALVLTWNRTCSCDVVLSKDRYNFFELRRETWEIKPPHTVCAACGECEAEVMARGDKLTVNHVTPRNGIPTTEVDCIHHLGNLEVLCWREHDLLNRLGNRRELLDHALKEAG